MYEVVDQLIAKGYSDICIERYVHKEESRGYQDEDEYWTAVARNPAGAPVRVSAEKHTGFSPGAVPAYLEVGSDQPISEEDYDGVRAEKGIADTDEYRRQLAARLGREESIRRERAAATAKLNQIRPACPACSRQMVPRSGLRGWFWGCDSFPKCRGTKNMSGHAQSLLKRGAS
ncbi:MAG: topoisomerase DNA-binding C4 zinc finger domain-containing protein [Myxococcales bacterium]|nr:topoisomerase DNA-binding C4 zinc finger domain-containing protein [Myxococcales bacterium]